MNRNEEIRAILRSREVAAEQLRLQREIAAKRTKPMTLEHGFVRDSRFPKKLFGK